MSRMLLLVLTVCMPLRNISLNSPFGYRIHPVTGCYSFHAGVDLRARHDTVFAVFEGTVAAEGFGPLAGIYVRLEHPGFESGYAHLSRLLVLTGDYVSAGDAIGITGATGRVTGEHLHFSIRCGNRPVDPLLFLTAIINHLKQ